ncbi:MAG: glutathione S-transferase family protein [Pseudomonadota bacterium]
MKVISRNLSPFGRRVMIWLKLQDRPFEQVPLQTAGPDFETLKATNPAGRIPTVVLDDGTRLVDSFAICDYLESTAPVQKRLFPQEVLARRDTMQAYAQSSSVAEKGVALVYDKNRRPEQYHWKEWLERLEGQIKGGLQDLEALAPEAGFIGGEAPNAADIGLVTTYDFIEAVNPYLLEDGYPKLSALAARANALPAFETTHPKHT